MLNLFQHPARDIVRRMPLERQPCVYILASQRMGTLYIGVTSNLAARLHQHSQASRNAFTGRYGVTRLVHFELFDDMPTAIAREKQLKRWHREWKINLIERDNPEWRDGEIEMGLIAVRDSPSRSLDPETSSG